MSNFLANSTLLPANAISYVAGNICNVIQHKTEH